MATEAGLSLLDLAPVSGHGDVFCLILSRLRLQDLQVSCLQLVFRMLHSLLKRSITSVQALLLCCKHLRSAVEGTPQKAWRSAGEHCGLLLTLANRLLKDALQVSAAGWSHCTQL